MSRADARYGSREPRDPSMLIYRTHAENLLSLSFLYIVCGLVSIESIWLQPFTYKKLPILNR